MRAYRICKARWATTAFYGIGAAENPGRWNAFGQKAIYCADSRSLGALEILAHVTRKRTLSKAKFVVFPVEVPDDLIHVADRLPRGWDAKPNTTISQKYGSRLIHSRAAVKFPSAVTRGEFNLVLNPAHPEFSKITWEGPEALIFDVRVVSVLKATP